MVRFITSVISGSLKINNRKRADILSDLVTQGYDKLGSGGAAKKVRISQVDNMIGGRLSDPSDSDRLDLYIARILSVCTSPPAH